MTDGLPVAPGRTRSAEIPNSQARRARYLQALAELSPHQAHDLRARLGTIGLHCELAYELLSGQNGSTAEALERARAELLRVRAGLEDASRALDAVIGLVRRRPAARERFDARDLVRDLEAALASALKGRRIEWNVQLPAGPAMVEGDREALTQAAIVAVVEAVAGATAGSRVEWSLSAEGGMATCVVEIRPDPCIAEGESALQELTVVHAEYESQGGRATSQGPGRLEFALPLCVED